MRKCPTCGDSIYTNDDLMCFRCRQRGARLRHEIYDNIKDDEDAIIARFSDIVMGGFNYRRIRRRNLQDAGA